MMSNVGGALSLYRVNKEESVLLRLSEEREREYSATNNFAPVSYKLSMSVAYMKPTRFVHLEIALIQQQVV